MIRIKPIDTLFFRDGKPFNMGEDNWADSVFPPLPSVAYGALRSSILSKNMKYFEKLGEKEDLSSKLRIKGIYYGIEKSIGQDTLFLPLPLDLVKFKNQNDHKAYLTEIRKLDDVIYDQKTEYVLTLDENIEQVEGGLIDLNNFSRYLTGRRDQAYIYTDLEDYIVREAKTGIARDSTRTSKDHMLYRINMIRPKNLVYIIDYDGVELPSKGFLKFGGQGKPSYFTDVNYEIGLNQDFFGSDDRYFKLYLMTPGLFSKGWLPSFIDEDTKEFSRGKIKGKLITAVIGRHKFVGGFDMEKMEPKPMLKAVPEGSVYYFKLTEGSMKDVLDEFNYQSICDYGAEYVNRGFGIVLVGRVIA